MDNQKLLAVWLVVLGTLVFLGGLWAWYSNVHQSAYRVFWDSVDNNLNIYGVTRTIEQNNNGSTVNQKLQLFLGAENIARGRTTVTQPNQTGGTTTVVTETVGTPTNNYARYVDIQTGEGNSGQPDTSRVLNVWSREVLLGGEQQNESVLSEAIFSSIPFAYLPLNQRQEVVQFMKDNDVYEVDYRNAKKVERAGKQAYEYQVTVNLKGYIETLQKVDRLMGLEQLTSVNSAAYEGATPAELVVISSIDGRQVLEITYNGSNRTEKYSSYGARLEVDIPETEVLRSELEQRVQEVFSSDAAVGS